MERSYHYSPYSPPPRPSSAGPSTSAPVAPFSASPSRSPSRSGSVQLPSQSSPLSSPPLVRPTAFSMRRETTTGQTRLRARSIGKAGPLVPPAHLSPTLPGTPVVPAGAGGFAQEQQRMASPLARARARDEDQRRRYGSSESLGEDSSAPLSSTEGTEESGSTRSDSPPPTPKDGDGLPIFQVIPASRRGSRVEWGPRAERENWRTGGELDEDAHPEAKELNTRNRSKSLEGQTRMSLRRGKSFTSLIGPPPGLYAHASPAAVERKDPLVAPPPPIFETYEPPTPRLSDVESSEERYVSPSTSSYPPTLTADTLALPLLAPKTLRDFVPQLAILFALFVSSFAVILLAISTLPGLFLPHSVSDLPSLTAALSTYRTSSFLAEAHLFAVLTLLFLWKQCFSIPGSVLTNILFGALYGTWMGTAWACLWTATGSTGAYLIAVIIAPLVEYYFATPLNATRRALKLPNPAAAESPLATAGVAPLSSSDLFSHLMLARLFPLLPYSVLNVISGVLRLPLSPFFLTLLLGSFPFNFATVSIGELVALAAADPSTPLGDKIWSKEVILKLVAVTLVSVLPVLFKEQLKRLIASGGFSTALERVKSLLARSAFGFSAVPHAATTTHQTPHHTPSSSLSAPRAWRRKLSRSIGGAGEFLQLAAAGAGLTGRRGYERVSSIAAMEGGGGGEGRHEMSEGVEEAEMGGLHVGAGGLN
ncbi:hypothetical protein JCM10213_009006 [Rhodosporidiobolus nylandii]